MDFAGLRGEIRGLRQEVQQNRYDMYQAVKMVADTLDKDQTQMQALVRDVSALRGRQGGGWPRIASDCSALQATCGECLRVPSCIWCEVEQRCYHGDQRGPTHGECNSFRQGGENSCGPLAPVE